MLILSSSNLFNIRFIIVDPCNYSMLNPSLPHCYYYHYYNNSVIIIVIPPVYEKLGTAKPDRIGVVFESIDIQHLRCKIINT